MKLNKYDVILLEEGMGNLGTCFYYTRSAIESAADKKIFEGKKAYANHPSKFEEQVLPERSVRDIIGYYSDIEVREGNAGQALLCGTLNMPIDPNLDWAKALVECSLDSAGKFNDDFVGLSINAKGASEEIELESFMNESTIPVSALAKLIKARSEGITTLEVCSRLVEAVSADLVTDAGAGGRILKMLESERNRTMPKKKIIESKKKMKEADGDGSGDAPNAGMDVEMLKGLLQKYCGSEAPTDEEMQAMHQAMENATEMGLKGKDAEDMAGNAMKMAKHVAEKEAKEAEEAEEGADDGAGDSTPPPAKKPPAPAAKKPPAAAAGASDDEDDTNTQETKQMESRVSTLEAENAKLAAKLEASEAASHLEKVLRESKLPQNAQKKFRESMGSPKSAKAIDEKLKFFVEAFGVGSDSAGNGFVNPEKASGSAGEGGGMDFSDCLVGADK
jgi:hypothetical protein